MDIRARGAPDLFVLYKKRRIIRRKGRGDDVGVGMDSRGHSGRVPHRNQVLSALTMVLVALAFGLSVAALALVVSKEDKQHQDGSGGTPPSYIERLEKSMGISTVTVSAVALVAVAGIVSYVYVTQPDDINDYAKIPVYVAIISALMAVAGILSLVFGSILASGKDAAGVSYALIVVSVVMIACAIKDPFILFGEGGQTFTGIRPVISRGNPDA